MQQRASRPVAGKSRQVPPRGKSTLRTKVVLALLSVTTLVGMGLIVAPIAYIA